jgi:hypothetical protein
MAEATDQAKAVELASAFFKAPDEQHFLVESQQLLGIAVISLGNTELCGIGRLFGECFGQNGPFRQIEMRLREGL